MLISQFRHNFRRFSRYFSAKVRILGLETSCDDTGVAIVDGDGTICAESLKSQQYFSTKFGGVIPNFAAKQHRKNLGLALNECLLNSGLKIEDIEAIAVTVRPGLLMCLDVGIEFAIDLCRTAKKPLIPIHHMRAHALTPRMIKEIPFPYMCLLVSGGHALITLVKSPDDFLLLGHCIDLSPGDILDKIARRLKLLNVENETTNLVSGGALIERYAQKGDPLSIPMPEPRLREATCNFSLGGIFTYAMDFIENQEQTENIVTGGRVVSNYADICASVQHGVFLTIVKKLLRAFEYTKRAKLISDSGHYPNHLVVSGGVASNQYLRNWLTFLCHYFDCEPVFPPPKYCTDNGVMIAWNGVEKWRIKSPDILFDIPDTIESVHKCPIGKDMTEDIKRNVMNRHIRHLNCIKLNKNFYLEQKPRRMEDILRELDESDSRKAEAKTSS